MRAVKANTKIEPIISYLEKEIPKEYYLSDSFKRDCIREGVDGSWESYMEYVKQITPHTYCFGVDFNKQFINGTLTLCMNDVFERHGAKELFVFVRFLLDSYTSNESKVIKTLELKKSFAVIGISEEELTLLDKYDKIPFAMDISKELSLFRNSNRLEQLKKEIDESFAKGNYRDVNTRSYTLLEGVFKEFLQENGIDYDKGERITKLASIIKKLLLNNTKFSGYFLEKDNAVSLITSITHVVNDLRNNNSDSHYGEDSDMATSCFVKDLTFSVTNLLLNITKKV